jgi:hypothetical protein
MACVEGELGRNLAKVKKRVYNKNLPLLFLTILDIVVHIYIVQ